MDSKKPRMILALILAAAIAVFAALVFSSFSISAAGFMIRPFTAAGLTIARVPKFFQDRNSLRRENAELRRAILRLSVSQAELDALRAELDSLSKLSGYIREESLPAVTARIVGVTRDPFRTALSIDKGTKDGVRQGDAVIIEDGIFAGRIEQAEETRSTVLLARDRKSKVAARVSGREGAVGLLEGHGVVYRLTLLPRESVFEINDVVLTAPSGVGFREYVAGIITGIEDIPKSPFRTAIVEPFARIGEFRFVAVVIH